MPTGRARCRGCLRDSCGPLLVTIRLPRGLTFFRLAGLSFSPVVLGISRATSYAAVSRGEIHRIRIGRGILIPKVALVRVLDGAGADGEKPELHTNLIYGYRINLSKEQPCLRLSAAAGSASTPARPARTTAGASTKRLCNSKRL